MNSPQPPLVQTIHQLHQLYGQLTGQTLSLRFDREQLWYHFLKAGFTPQDLRHVIGYLQLEIRNGRRNVGALKLSNLLQPDRFEEDLNISRVRLRPPQPSRPARQHVPSALSPKQLEQRRQLALQRLQELKENLRQNRL